MSARPATQNRCIRDSVYGAFHYGYGAPSADQDWGFDLGRPVTYSKQGTVHRQQFEHGVTLANVGDRPVRVGLGDAYLDLSGVPRTSVLLAPRSGDVLRRRTVLTSVENTGG